MGEGAGGLAEPTLRPVTSLEDVLQWAASGGEPEPAVGAACPSSARAGTDGSADLGKRSFREVLGDLEASVDSPAAPGPAEARAQGGGEPQRTPKRMRSSSSALSSTAEAPNPPVVAPPPAAAGRPGVRATASPAGKLASPKAIVGQRNGFRGLAPDGLKDVEGFQLQGLKVARVAKKLPKTQSWCFVPLIYSALGRVPERLRREGFSSAEQIEAAQSNWEGLFSHWSQWRSELLRAVEGYGRLKFESDFLPKETKAGTGWTTSLVYGEPRVSGRLPHPHGSCQDRILNLLPCDTQNQIFASVMSITSPG